MKKLLLLLFCLPAFAYTQTIPNGAFENWSNLSFDNPNYWLTANMDGNDGEVFTVTKVSGSVGYALRMETKSVNSKLLESWIMTSEGDPRLGQGGYPYSQKPSSFSGKFRCNIVSGDTGFMVAMFKKNGTIIGSSTATFTGVTNTFANFTFPVLIGTTPDSVIIVGSSSNLMNEIGVQAGSWLEIDELVFGGTGITQPILNGNFESWTQYNTVKIQSWNMYGEDGVKQIADPFKGTYAVKLTTFNDPQDGLRQCGLRLSEEDNGQIIKRGVPYTLLQDTLFGYYKLTTPGTDHAYVFARTFKNGNQVGWFGKDLNPSSTYQYFEIIISNPTQPDSLDVVIESSSQSTMVEGTTLIIDEIQLASSKLNTTGIESRNPFGNNKLKVYPNPTTGALYIESNQPGVICVKVYNSAGDEVLNQIMDASNKTALDIAHLNNGLYIVSVGTENGNIGFSRFLKN